MRRPMESASWEIWDAFTAGSRLSAEIDVLEKEAEISWGRDLYFFDWSDRFPEHLACPQYITKSSRGPADNV